MDTKLLVEFTRWTYCLRYPPTTELKRITLRHNIFPLIKYLSKHIFSEANSCEIFLIFDSISHVSESIDCERERENLTINIWKQMPDKGKAITAVINILRFHLSVLPVSFL